MNKAVIAAILASSLLAGCGQGADAPEMTAQQLMANEVQPTAEIYWNSVQYISDETGNHDIFPKNDEEWARTKAAATKLGELAELMKTPGYAEGRGNDWTEFASSLAEVSKLAEAAADAKDPDKVFEVGGTVYSVCSACHLAYPPENAEEERPGDAEVG